MGLVGIEECVFVPSRGALGLLLGCCLGPLLLLGCFGFSFWVPLYTFCVLKRHICAFLGLLVWVSFVYLRRSAFSFLCT
jgi:hypothetical protein